MSNTISSDQLSEAIGKELTIYSESVIDGIKKAARKHMKLLVEQTKATAPVGNRDRHYRDSIKSKKVTDDYRSIELLWYVDGSDYRLSHLLENGHATKNGGRVEGTHFIKNASDKIIEDYIRTVEEVVKNG